MKKPFKNTLVGKLLTGPVLKSALSQIPVAGPFIENVLEDVKGDGLNEIISPAGSVDMNKAKLQMKGLMLLAAIASGIALFFGWLTIDQIKSIAKIFGV